MQNLFIIIQCWKGGRPEKQNVFSESGSYSECLGKLLEYTEAGTKETAPREAEELSMFPVSRRGTVYLVFWEVLQVQSWALN